MKNTNRIMTITFSFILLATAFTGAVTVGNQIVEKETDPWQYPIFQIPELKVIIISFTHRSQLQELINHGLDIVDVKDSKATAYITDSELAWICESGFKYEMLFENLEEMNNKMYPPELMRQFHNYATMTSELQDIADTYPDIVQLYDLGNSVLGRTIWGL